MAGVARRRLEPGSAVERDAARLLGLASVHRGRRERTLRGIWERGGEDGSRFEGCDVVWAVVTSKDYAPLAAAKVLVCAEGHWVDEMVAVDGEVGRAAAVMALLSALEEPAPFRPRTSPLGLALQVLPGDSPCVVEVCEDVCRMKAAVAPHTEAWMRILPEEGGRVVHVPVAQAIASLRAELAGRLQGSCLFTRLHRGGYVFLDLAGHSSLSSPQGPAAPPRREEATRAAAGVLIARLEPVLPPASQPAASVGSAAGLRPSLRHEPGGALPQGSAAAPGPVACTVAAPSGLAARRDPSVPSMRPPVCSAPAWRARGAWDALLAECSSSEEGEGQVEVDSMAEGTQAGKCHTQAEAETDGSCSAEEEADESDDAVAAWCIRTFTQPYTSAGLIPYSEEGLWLRQTAEGLVDFGGDRVDSDAHVIDTVRRAGGSDTLMILGDDRTGGAEVFRVAGRSVGRTHAVIVAEVTAGWAKEPPQGSVFFTWEDVARSGQGARKRRSWTAGGREGLHTRLGIDWGGELGKGLAFTARRAWSIDANVASRMTWEAVQAHAASQDKVAGAHAVELSTLEGMMPFVHEDVIVKVVACWDGRTGEDIRGKVRSGREGPTLQVLTVDDPEEGEEGWAYLVHVDEVGGTTPPLKAQDSGEQADAGEGPARGRVSAAFWNTQGVHVKCGYDGMGKEERRRTGDKLDFLDAQLLVDRPCVLFLFEVSGTAKERRPIIAWLSKRKYTAHFVAGCSGLNGIVVAVDRGQGRIVDGKTVTLAERAVGVEVRCIADKQVRRFVGLHGINQETTGAQIDKDGLPIGRSFARQLHEVVEWTEAEGGVIVGDFNRVMCERWRSAQYRLTADDRRVRDAAGWRCACCDAGCRGGVGAAVVGIAAHGDGSPSHTRWQTLRGRRMDSTARIDYAICRGLERGEWRERSALPPDVGESKSGFWTVSDHAYVTIERSVQDKARLDVRRPMPFPVGRRNGDPAVRRRYGERVHEAAFAASLKDGAAAAGLRGGARLSGVTEGLVQAAKEVTEQVRIERKFQPSVRKETPKQRYQGWMTRLRSALQLAEKGGSPRHLVGSPLQYCKQFERMARLRKPDGEVWAHIIARCRREVKKAGREERRVVREQDEELYALARDASRPQVDAVVRMQRAWRAISGPRSSTALEAVWEGDRPVVKNADGSEGVGRRIVYSEAEFKPELRRVGEAFVEQMADTPACLPAFEAWCEMFMDQFDELKGMGGEDFVLAEELTWDLFNEVLYSMPGGKAVGAGGFHAELLKLSSEAVRRTFFEAMIADLKGHNVPETWRQVLYALLLKPPPNDPDVVGERREIALMAHDMKLLLQMVRRISYQRIVGRVDSDQAGWLAGFGCADPSVVVATAVQQCARLKQSVYLLYIDLSTFFPRLDRGAVTIAEAMHGLPKEVQELTLRIYGSVADKEGCVACKYDSAAGLGEGFKNWMGALMGCVLSPDKAKLFLNTVLVAIKAVCSGISLWGYAEGEARRIKQAAYADDWCGVFSSEQDLQRAWRVWTAWEAISGSKLGVKAKLKTVVTGARYVDGKVASVVDPLLRLRGGGYVPFAHHDETYKHLGNRRTASGSDVESWKHVKAKLLVALARIRRLRQPSVGEFIGVSNALIGGIAGYYLQTLYITFEQAEEIESRWRTIYRQKFGGTHEEALSKPRAFFYQMRGAKGAARRQHLWGVGLTAIVSSFNSAMADVEDTSQRASARSTVALAMESWGCRSNPGTWSWAHLATKLEEVLKRGQCKMLGEAWMLATALLEAEHDISWVEGEGDRSAWMRDFSSEQKAKWGRWRAKAPAGEPLHPGAAHWAPPVSTLISEPISGGGLGLEAEPWLLGAGVVAIGQMCGSSILTDGSVDNRWLSFKEARRSNTRLAAHGASEAAWNRQVERLQASGVAPAHAEPVTSRARTIASSMATQVVISGTGVRVDAVAVGSLLGELGDTEVRQRKSKLNWAASLRRCFPGVIPRKACEWAHGGRDRAREAGGGRFVMVANKARVARVSGGEARWCRRGLVGAAQRKGDEAGIPVGMDGWAIGWEAEAAGLKALMSFDDEGYAINVLDERVQGQELGELPPALQMSARARIAIGELKPDCPVVREAPTEKYKSTTVNTVVQAANHRELCEWQAKVRATAVYTVDGTRMVAGTKEAPEYVIARMALRHDGLKLGGRLHEPEGADNYIAELAGQMDLAHAEDEGGRIIVIFDATSPLLAMAKFRRMCFRRRQGYYVGEWLETLFRLLDRQEVVVLLWQTSHEGSPNNEWADIEAERAGIAEAYTPVVRLESESQTMLYTAPRRSAHGWATPLACGVVERRLKEALGETQMHDEFDIPPLALRDEVQRTCDAILGQRSCVGDARRFMGRAKVSVVKGAVCPFGCVDAAGHAARFTWLHAQVYCQQCDIVAARGVWVEACVEACDAMRPAGTNLPHAQIDEVCEFARNPGRAVGGRPLQLARGEISQALERSVRRLAGGLIRAPGDKKLERCKITRKVLVRMVEAGVNVQWEAHRLTKYIEDEACATAQQARLARKRALHWLRVTREGGPARAAALRAVKQAEQLVLDTIVDRASRGAISVEEAVAFTQALSTEGEADGVRMGSIVSAALLRARASNRRQGEFAYMQWRCVELGRRWRLRAALGQRVWDGVENPIEPGTTIWVDTVRAQIVLGEAMEMGRQAMGVTWGYRLVVPQARQLITLEQEAHKKWRAGGCWKGEKLRVAARATRRERRRVAEQGRSFASYMGQAPGSMLGLRGTALRPIEKDERVEITIHQRVRHRARTKAAGSKAVAPRAGSIQRRMFDAGQMPDRWGRWPVDKVLEVRRIRGSTRTNARVRREMRVRWRGVNPNTGLPWADTWVPYSDAGGDVANAALVEEARPLEAAKYGTSAPQRRRAAGSANPGLAGRTGPGVKPIPGRPARKRKWDAALRGASAHMAPYDNAFLRGRPVRRIADGESEDVGWGDLQRSRSRALADIKRVRGVGAGWRRRHRRAVVDESEDERAVDEAGGEEDGIAPSALMEEGGEEGCETD